MSMSPQWYVSMSINKNGEGPSYFNYGPFKEYYEADDWVSKTVCPSHSRVEIRRLDPPERFKPVA